MKNPIKDYNSSLKQVGPYLGLGTQMAVTIVLLTLLGKYIDDSYSTKPIFTIIGAFFGAFAGLYTFIRNVLTLNKKK